MQRAKCNKDCLNCIFPRCKYDVEDEHKKLKKHQVVFYPAHKKESKEEKSYDFLKEHPEWVELEKRYEKVRHALYYQEHRQEILERVVEYNFKNRNSETCHKYYIAHKDEINKRNQERYAKNREKRLAESKAYYHAHRAEISARRKARYKALKAKEQEDGNDD